MPRWRLVARRVIEWSGLAIGFVALYVQCWYVAFALEPVFRGRRFPSALDVIAPVAPLVELWLWAKGVENATDNRVPAGLVFGLAVAVMIALVIYTLSWPSPFPVFAAACAGVALVWARGHTGEAAVSPRSH